LLTSFPLPALEVEITSPSAGDVIVGSVQVVAVVTSTHPIELVELFLDEEKVAERTRPPYRFLIDVGNELAAHHLKITATDASGNHAATEVMTTGVAVSARFDANLQQLYATATNLLGTRVLDLRSDDLQVLDNGRPQDIVTFATGDIPFTAVLLIDASESMAGEPMRAAVDGARSFIAGMSSLDQAGVVVFADRVLTTTGLAARHELLLNTIDQVEVTGGSAAYDMLLLALHAIQAHQGRRVVIVLSDGLDVHSWVSMEQVRRTAHRCQAQIYWVKPEQAQALSAADFTSLEAWQAYMEKPLQHFDSWRSPKQHKQQRLLLEDTVRESGGSVIGVSTPAAVASAFAEVLRELREQYAIGYYPSEDTNDGSWHQVEVTARAHGVKIRSSEGYYDY